jgi:hypothetical protein
VQDALSPLPDWKDYVLADPSRKDWLEKFYLRWVSHARSIKQKSEKLSYLMLLVTEQMERKASGLQRIMTGD